MTITEQPGSTESSLANMDALVYDAPRVMTMHRIPVPVCGQRDVLVRVAYSGICGSELSGYLGQRVWHYYINDHYKQLFWHNVFGN